MKTTSEKSESPKVKIKVDEGSRQGKTSAAHHAHLAAQRQEVRSRHHNLQQVNRPKASGTVTRGGYRRSNEQQVA